MTDRSRSPDRACWRPLDGRGSPSSVVGGKAAALDRLVAHGAPVPRAAALTVEAYRAFVEAAGLGPFIAGLAGDVLPSGLAGESARVRDAFLRAPLAAPVAAAIRAAFDHACGPGGGSVAVRSSATAEDLASASFAGQHRSFLGVGEEGLEQAVRLCWASLWEPGARAYRRAQGFDAPEVAMGVVVQTMVEAEWSGVVFTRDPTGWDPEVLRIEMVEGLGERLVSGEATPAVFNVRRPGTVEAEEGAPSFLADLVRLSLGIEEAQGGPQDIEWSVAGGRLHILQARPVTAGAASPGDGFDTRPVPGTTFTPAGVGEMLPGVVPPLLWTMNAPMLEDAFAVLFERLGVRPAGTAPMVGRFRGRAALNLSVLKAAARRMPRGSGAEVERQYLGRVFTEEPEALAPSRRERLIRMGPALRALRLRRSLVGEAEVFLEAAALAVTLEPDLTGVPTESLVSYRRRVRDLARRGVRTEVGVAASAAANYRGLEVVLERWLGPEEAPLAAQRLTAGRVREQAGGCAAVLSLWDLHCDWCQLPEVAHAVYDGPVEGTEGRLSALGPSGLAFLHLVEHGLGRAGSAAVYGGPTWDEERHSLWSLLRQCRSPGTEAAPAATMTRAADEATAFLDELEHRLTRTRKWRRTRVLTGQVVDVRRRLLRRMVADAATFLRLREAVKSAVLQVGGEERRVVRELTRRLVDDGTLQAPGDEWFLADDELDGLALGHGGPTAETLEGRRVAWEAARAAPPLPEVFSGVPTLHAEPMTDTPGNVIHGWATSPGRVTGRALVVHDLSDALGVEAGEILVGHATDPSWTPLFLTAAGIVMEQGGPLSHAAIVARELRLPAVLNAKGATTRVRTGMTITVDGTRGTVEIADDGERAGAAA